MVHYIWLTLQVHMSMVEFICDGLKYNLAISTVFVRFFDKANWEKCQRGIWRSALQFGGMGKIC